MSLKQRALHVLEMDFAVLTTIVGTWCVGILTGAHAAFGDLVQLDNLRKLVIMLVGFIVLYAQRIRTTGDVLVEPPTVEEEGKDHA